MHWQCRLSLELEVLEGAQVDRIGRNVAGNGGAQALEGTLHTIGAERLPDALEDRREGSWTGHQGLVSQYILDWKLSDKVIRPALHSRRASCRLFSS